MKQLTKTITNELQALSDAEKREIFPKFFKAGKGEYGEGDRFLGVTVPNIRAIAKLHKVHIHRGDTGADTVRMA